MLVFFPVFGAFVRWVIFVYLGLEGLGVLVLLCLFFFFVLVLFLFCLLCFGLVVRLFLVLVLVLFCFFLFFCFCFFFGGFKGQVRWPKGPPHLALNPPYFICFVFLFLFFCFCFFCFVFFIIFVLCFPSFVLMESPVFTLKKAILVYLSVIPFVSL